MTTAPALTRPQNPREAREALQIRAAAFTLSQLERASREGIGTPADLANIAARLVGNLQVRGDVYVTHQPPEKPTDQDHHPGPPGGPSVRGL